MAMKQISEYCKQSSLISEYLLSKNNTKASTDVAEELDKTYKNFDELVDDFNKIFADRLLEPIKVHNELTLLSPVNSQTRNGHWVDRWFMMEFNDNDTRIRFGYRKNDLNNQLVMQAIYYINGKTSYGTMTRYCGYRFDESFLKWLKSLDKEITSSIFKVLEINA